MKYTLNIVFKKIIPKLWNKKVIKKRAAKVMAVVTAGSVVAVLPFSSMMRSMAAADTFMDLDDRIAGSSDFSLVEIADDYEQASMGYFASGYEPFREFEAVTDQTSGYEYDPTVGIGDVVSDLQGKSIMSKDADAGETDYPMTFELKAYDPANPPSVIKNSNGETDDDYYILNAGKGLIGRELVPGYYVQSDSGRYVEDKSVIDIRDAKSTDNTDLEMSLIGKGLKATVVGKGNAITLSLPSDAISSGDQSVIWTIGSTKIVNIVDPTSSLVSVSKTKDTKYFFTGSSLSTITIKGLDFGNTYVSAKVVNLATSEISQSNIADIENRYVASDSSGNYKIYNGIITCAEPAAETVYFLAISDDGGKTYYYKKTSDLANKIINVYIGNDKETVLNAYIGTVDSDGVFKPVSRTATDFVYTWTNNYYDNIDITTDNNTESISGTTQTSQGTSIKLFANSVKKYTDLSVKVQYSDSAEYKNYDLPEEFLFDVEVVDSYYAVYNYNGQLKAIVSENDGLSTITMSEDDCDSSGNYVYTIKYLEWDESTSAYKKLSTAVSSDTMLTKSLASGDDNTYTLTLKPNGTKNASATITPEGSESSNKLKFVLNYASTVSDGQEYYDNGDYIAVPTGDGESSISLTASVINADDTLNHTSKNESMYTYDWTASDYTDVVIENEPEGSKYATITYTGNATNYEVKLNLKVLYDGTTVATDFASSYTLVFNCDVSPSLYVKYGDNYYNVSKNHITSTSPIKVTNKDDYAVVSAVVGSSYTNGSGEEVFIKKSGTYTYKWAVNVDTSTGFVKTKLNLSSANSASTKLMADETGTYSFSLEVTDSNGIEYTYKENNNVVPYYIAFSFYSIYTISSDNGYSDEKEISGTYYPVEIMSTGASKTFYIGSSNENFVIKDKVFTDTSGVSGTLTNSQGSAQLESASYGGTSSFIKGAKKLTVSLSQSGTLSVVLGPENSDDTDDYLTLVFSSVVIYKVDGALLQRGSSGYSLGLESVTYSTSGTTFKYTIGSNSGSLNSSGDTGCAAVIGSASQVSDDSEIQYEYTLTLTISSGEDHTITIQPSSDTSPENTLTLTIETTQIRLMTSMYFSTYSADSIDDVSDIENTDSTGEESEDLTAGDEYTVTLSLDEIGNFVFETNMQVETEESFEESDTGEESGDDSTGSGSENGEDANEDLGDADESSEDDNGSTGEDNEGSDDNDGGSGEDNEGSGSDNEDSGSDNEGSGDDSQNTDEQGSESSDQTRLDNTGKYGDGRLYMAAAASDEGGSTGSSDDETDSDDEDSSSSSSNKDSGSDDTTETKDDTDKEDVDTDKEDTDNKDTNKEDNNESDDLASGKSGSKDITGDTSVKEESANEGRYVYTLPIIPDGPGIYTIILKPVGSDNEEDYVTIKVVIVDNDDTDGAKSSSKLSSKSSSSASASTLANDKSDAANSASTKKSGNEASTQNDEATSSKSSSTNSNSSSSTGGSAAATSNSTGGTGGSGNSSGNSGNSQDNSGNDVGNNGSGNGNENTNNTENTENAGDGEEGQGSGDGGSDGDSDTTGSDQNANSQTGSASPSDTINDPGVPASSEPAELRHRMFMAATGTGADTGSATDTNTDTSDSEEETVKGNEKFDNAKTMDGGYYILTCAEDDQLLSGVSTSDRYNFSLTKPSSGTYFAGYGYAYYITINYDWLKYYVFGDDETNSSDNNVNLTLYLYTLCDTFDTSSDNYNSTMSDVESVLADADLVYLSADGMTDDGKSAIGSGESDSEKIYDITTTCARAVVTASYAGSGASGDYPQAVIVNRSIYDNNSSSGLSTKAVKYYSLARLLMTNIKDNIILNTTGLSSDDDGVFWSALSGISSYTSFSSGTSTYTASKDVTTNSGAYNYSNIFVGKYNSGDFGSSIGSDYTNVPEVFNRGFAYTYTNSTISSGFDEVLEFIIKENVYRGRKNVGNMSYSVSPSVVVQYILIFAASDLTLYKSSISVLELEPCYAFKYYQYDDGGSDVEYRQAQRAEVFAERFAPNLSLLEDSDYMSGTFEQGSAAQQTILNRVKITGMTTSEFAGVIGDPCEDYDVIYIGSQTVDTAIFTYSVTSSSTTSYYYGIKDTTTTIMNTNSTTALCTGMTETVTGMTDSNGIVWEWCVDNKVNDCYGRWRKRNANGNYVSNMGKPSWISYTASDGTVYNWDGSNWYKSARYTVYNSSDMNGIVYSHIGDSMNDSAMYVDGVDMGSASVTHYSSVNLRLSGNDITSIQEKELENFLELGYPVIVSDDLFTYNTTMNSAYAYDSSVVPTGISAGYGKLTTTSGTFAGKLDTNSQMYKFLKAGMGDDFSQRNYTNFVTESIGSKFTDLITEGLNESKLTLDVTATPTEYVAVTNGNTLDPNQCVFLSPASDGQYYLDFDFTITDVANPDLLDATYTVQLFLDSNGDGRFAGSTDETKTDEQKSSTFTEEIMNLTITGGSTSSLMPYTSYHLTRQLPNGYYGSVAWKLKITNNKPNSDDSTLCSHDSITGICAVIPSGVEEQIEINILQIYPYIPNSSTDGGGSAISQTYDIIGAVDRDLSYQQYYNQSSDWYSMLENIPGYDVNIYSISSYEFATSYEKNYDATKINEESDILEVQLEGGHLVSNTTIAGNFNEAIDRNGDGDTDDDNERPTGPTTLSSYDMVIVGFTDMFPNIPNENSVRSLVTYGKSGRSMLFTHDTTSWIYDTALYGQVGLDANSAGKTYKQYVVQSQWSDWFASSYLSNAIRDLCGMDRFGFVGANNVYGSSYSTAYDPTPYLPNSGTELSGLYRLATTNHSIYSSNRDNTYQNLAVGTYTNRNSNKNAFYVSLVNEGTISKYPYDLEDEMFVANTHGQYFQLNLDMDNNSDGESDITVWYTIDSRDTDTNGNGIVESGEHIQNFVSTYTKNGTNDVYEASPHDVRNNYYIYNRGNISYSGVGHSAVTACTTPEVQLFINTMIMAYNSGVKAASLSITDDGFAKELTTDKIPYDAYAQELYTDSEVLTAETSTSSQTTSSKDDVDAVNVSTYYPVYFTLTDLNVGIQTSSIRVNFSYGMRSDQYSYDPSTGTSSLGTYGASYGTSTVPTNLYPVYLCADADGDGAFETRTQLTASGSYYTIYQNESDQSSSNAFVTYYLEVDIPLYDLNNNGIGISMDASDTLDIYVHSALTGKVNGVTSTVYSTDSMSLLRQELYDLD